MFLTAKEWQEEYEEKKIQEGLVKHNFALTAIMNGFREALLYGNKDSIVITAKIISSKSLGYKMYKTSPRGGVIKSELSEEQSNTFELVNILRRNGYYVSIDRENQFISVSYHDKAHYSFSHAHFLNGADKEKSIAKGETGINIFTENLNKPVYRKITFEVPFTEPPEISATLHEKSPTWITGISVSDITEKGFKVWAVSSSEASILINWIATKKQ